jgi:hypothetical protein
MFLRVDCDGGFRILGTAAMKLIDRKTGKEVRVGDSLIRKNYKGFKHRYEVLDINKDSIHVRKLGANDAWVYLNVQPEALQLTWVLA